MAQEWNIRSRGHECSICGKPLEDRSLVVSALREREGSGFARFDCHTTGCKGTTRDWEPFSQWDGVYLAPVKEEKKEALKKEDAGELFRHLMTLDDPAMKNVVYVLAVMLERSKILVERDAKSQENGTILRIYENRKSGETYLVVDPRLRLENLSEVQQQVVALLSGTKTLGEVAAHEEQVQQEEAAHDEEAPRTATT